MISLYRFPDSIFCTMKVFSLYHCIESGFHKLANSFILFKKLPQPGFNNVQDVTMLQGLGRRSRVTIFRLYYNDFRYSTRSSFSEGDRLVCRWLL